MSHRRFRDGHGDLVDLGRREPVAAVWALVRSVPAVPSGPLGGSSLPVKASSCPAASATGSCVSSSTPVVLPNSARPGPLPDRSVDVVISNCVVNLSGDKAKVLAEAARVLKPGGRFAVSDVIADPDMDDATKADMAAWTGCIAGALTEAEFPPAAGLEDVQIRETTGYTNTLRRNHPRAQARGVVSELPLNDPEGLYRR